MEGGVCYTSIYTTITIDNRQEHGRGGMCYTSIYTTITIGNRRPYLFINRKYTCSNSKMFNESRLQKKK